MTTSSSSNNEDNNDDKKTSPPRRFIYNDVDMASFQASPAKKELLRLVNVMGKSCAASTTDNTAAAQYRYNPQEPLVGLSPATACLHGSLTAMLATWLTDYPPLDQSRARFGNPAFRDWHGRLVERSVSIVHRILAVHQKYPGVQEDCEASVLQECWQDGKEAAGVVKELTSIESEEDRIVVRELCAYLQDAFGHAIRLDYGTGHECSFQVLLFALCKLDCFGSTSTEPPSVKRLKAITLSIYSAYLAVCRQLQTDYMLEPAGSHGVWGLDDYHCLPFYFGACQLQADGSEDYGPKSIHEESTLAREADTFLYFGCIKHIKNLKKGVPFFESSPMLNDISHLENWQRVASGLFKLYEGEVLNKRQVVQHFVFGKIFAANWKASEQPRAPPSAGVTFRTPATTTAPMVRAPWATGDGPMPPTKAPWAK